MATKKYKEAREATKMALGIALHQTRQEMGGLSVEDVAKTIRSVWHISDIEVLVRSLTIEVGDIKIKEGKK